MHDRTTIPMTTRLSRFVFTMQLACVLLAAGGCAHTLRFQTLDGRTEQPIPNVQVEWCTVVIRLIGSSYTTTNLVTTTQTNGMLSISDASLPHFNRFHFASRGYLPAEVLVRSSTPEVHVLSTLSSGSVVTNKVDLHDLIPVRLYPGTK